MSSHDTLEKQAGEDMELELSRERTEWLSLAASTAIVTAMISVFTIPGSISLQ